MDTIVTRASTGSGLLCWPNTCGFWDRVSQFTPVYFAGRG